METPQEKCFENAEKLLKEAYGEMLMGLKHESECSELTDVYVQKVHDSLIQLSAIIKNIK